MKLKSTIILLTVVLFSCQTKTWEEYELTSPTLVHIAPDSLVIEQLVQKWGEEDFQATVDDVIWYHSELMMLVDTLKIDQITTESKNISLIGGEKTWKIATDTLDYKWHYIYFNGNDFIEKDAYTMKEYLLKNN